MPAPAEDSLIDYPGDFPIKIVGLTHEGFTDAIARIVIQHDPTFHASKIGTRSSSRGKYLSLTVTVYATSRAQLDALYQTLSAHEMVRFVL